jgi:hypothetical protein
MTFEERTRRHADAKGLADHLLHWQRVVQEMFLKHRSRPPSEDASLLTAEDKAFLKDWARVMAENHASMMSEAFPPEHPMCRCVARPFCKTAYLADKKMRVIVHTFGALSEALEKGEVLRRVAWKPNVSGIVKLPNTRFVTLLLPAGTSKPWQPYAEDFAADDWYVV